MSLPKRMRALRQMKLEGPKGLRFVDDAPVPEPGRGEVLIRVAAAGVNFVDIVRSHGTFGDNPQPPFVAGFEAVGEVVAIGEEVTSPAIGAKVTGVGAGAFAEYMVVPAMAAGPVPNGWAVEEALGLAINWPKARCIELLARFVLGGAGDWKMTPTSANGQPAAFIHRRDAEGAMQPNGIVVLEATAAGVSGVVAFHHDPALVGLFR